MRFVDRNGRHNFFFFLNKITLFNHYYCCVCVFFRRDKNENYVCKPQLRSETLDGDFHVTDEARGFS